MKKAATLRIALLAACLLALEAACRFGYVSQLTIVPPSEMTTGLIAALGEAETRTEIVTTLTGIACAALASVSVGFLLGCLPRAWPRARTALDPLLATYYAVPTLP